MVLRYSGSAGAGMLVTAALILGMQQLISTGSVDPLPPRPIVFMGPVRLPPPQPPKPQIDRPPPRPEPAEPQPATPSIAIAPVPGPTGPITRIGPPTITGPTGLRGGDFGGGTGSWTGGGELMLVASATPAYPPAAISRNLEGSVIVEFTVTPQGTVRDPRIVESTHAVFERAALSAVTHFRYQPRVIDGVPIAVGGVRAVINFELSN